LVEASDPNGTTRRLRCVLAEGGEQLEEVARYPAAMRVVRDLLVKKDSGDGSLEIETKPF